MNKRDTVRELFYVVEGYDARGECVKRIPAYGATKDEAGLEAMQHAQNILGQNGVVKASRLWAGKEKL